MPNPNPNPNPNGVRVKDPYARCVRASSRSTSAKCLFVSSSCWFNAYHYELGLGLGLGCLCPQFVGLTPIIIVRVVIALKGHTRDLYGTITYLFIYLFIYLFTYLFVWHYYNPYPHYSHSNPYLLTTFTLTPPQS